jgi:hypothetical protein
LNGKVGEPEDIVRAAVHLASEDSAWITGEVKAARWVHPALPARIGQYEPDRLGGDKKYSCVAGDGLANESRTDCINGFVKGRDFIGVPNGSFWPLG